MSATLTVTVDCQSPSSCSVGYNINFGSGSRMRDSVGFSVLLEGWYSSMRRLAAVALAAILAVAALPCSAFAAGEAAISDASAYGPDRRAPMRHPAPIPRGTRPPEPIFPTSTCTPIRAARSKLRSSGQGNQRDRPERHPHGKLLRLARRDIEVYGLELRVRNR